MGCDSNDHDAQCVDYWWDTPISIEGIDAHINEMRRIAHQAQQIARRLVLAWRRTHSFMAPCPAWLMSLPLVRCSEWLLGDAGCGRVRPRPLIKVGTGLPLFGDLGDFVEQSTMAFCRGAHSIFPKGTPPSMPRKHLLSTGLLGRAPRRRTMRLASAIRQLIGSRERQ